jgi:glycosyltransferase involved in cell wall biosynthesis
LILALDATYSLDPEPSGVAVYSREILHGLARAHPEARFRFCYRPHRFLKSFAAPLPGNALRSLIWKNATGGRADLFHALNQRVDSNRHARVVCTFHDLFVISGAYSTPEFRERFTAQAREAAARSDLIIAVSEFTASQVHELLEVPREKIRVVHHGVHLPAEAPPISDRERTILFVGAIQKRKNVTRLVKAFEKVEPGWKLVLAGSQGYGADETLAALAASPRRNDIEIAGFITPEQLAQLWRRAAVFAFPSLDEGFGIPVLEAMAHGVPVLTSNCSALPEVAGDAAVLVDPLSVESIGSGLTQLMTKPQLRDELSRRGRARAENFSWNQSLEKTWSVYGELLDGPPQR